MKQGSVAGCISTLPPLFSPSLTTKEWERVGQRAVRLGKPPCYPIFQKNGLLIASDACQSVWMHWDIGGS